MRWEVGVGAWAVALLGLARGGGVRSALNALAFGAAPVVVLAWTFRDALAHVTGLFTREAVERAKQRERQLKRGTNRNLQADSESVEWLNFFLERLWPYIAAYVEAKIRSYEPTLQSLVPIPGANIRFGTCSLGQKPLKLGPVKPRLVSSYYNDKLVPEGGVELLIGVNYHSDVDVVLASSLASVGVANISITGTLSVLLRPLMDKSPLIGGVEVVCTNPPNVDLEFKGIAGVADLPGVRSTVRRIIDDAIAGIIVMPMCKAYAVSDDPAVDLARLRNPFPAGVLRLTIARAEELEAKDWKWGTKTSDPYVVVKLGIQSHRTPVMANTCNPVWTEGNVSDFLVHSKEQWVQIDVFDSDKYDSDDHLGCIRHLPVHALLERAGSGVAPMDLEAEDGSQLSLRSRLFLSASWLTLVEPLDGPEVEGPNRYVVDMKIDECTGLPEKSAGAPFSIRVHLKGDRASSRSTAKGWAKPALVQATPMSLERVRKLAAKGVEAPVIAEVMDLDEALVKGFLEDEALRGAGGSADRQSLEDRERQLQRENEWIAKMHASRSELESARNPQFEEALRLPAPARRGRVVLELVRDLGKQARKLSQESSSSMDIPPDVVASCELEFGAEPLVRGPFALLDPQTSSPVFGSGARVHGSLSLWRLNCERPAS